MCGIFGQLALTKRSKQIEPAALRRGLESLAHRGPDEMSGIEVGTDCFLGMTRLAIVSPENGKQPFSLGDDLHAVFNGEIFNHHELRSRLERQGYEISNQSDGAVILPLFEIYGVDFASHLEGMFAIAIYDAGRRSLTLARDQLGKKPLFFSTSADSVTFGSEIKAIRSCLDSTIEPNLDSVVRSLFWGHDPSHETALKGIEKLQPGTTVTFAQDKRVFHKYFDPLEMVNEQVIKSQDEVWDLLTQATHIRTRDLDSTPVLLSGGIDSSLILAAAVETGAPNVKVFTLEDSPELPVAREISRRFGLEVTPVNIATNGKSHHETLVSTYNNFDEVFLDPSAVPTRLISLAIALTDKVALSGDGGDEGFGGYDAYSMALRGSLGPLSRVPLSKLLLKISRRSPNSALEMLLSSLGYSGEAGLSQSVHTHLRYAGLTSNELQKLLPGLKVQEVISQSVLASLRLGNLHESDLDSGLRRMQVRDIQTYLQMILRKVDTASMQSSLEIRSPFLDKRLLSTGLSLKSEAKLRPPKSLLRSLANERVGSFMSNLPKHGFQSRRPKFLSSESVDFLQTELGEGVLSNLVDETFLQNAIRTSQNNSSDRVLWALFALAVFSKGIVDARKS